MLLVVALLVGTTLGLLVLNTAIAVDSLKATQLRTDNADRAEEVQRLEQQVVSGSTPAEIARAAVAAGLVPAGAAAHLVIAARRLVGPARHPRARAGGRRGRGRELTRCRTRSDPGAFTSRRAPGSRRSGSGLSVGQRGLRNRWGLVIMITAAGRRRRPAGASCRGSTAPPTPTPPSRTGCAPIPIAALRGAVLDRDGNPLAYTVAASRVVADPTRGHPPGARPRGRSPRCSTSPRRS